ncbi:MAG TPA: TonB-dependent receptor, partial [Vicinamibacteria bacterium]|nr:TonB-dependent receptor [Vicinamibacteria bacterium]
MGKRQLFFPALVLCALASPAAAARITGTVEDAGGKPVPVAIVTVSAPGHEVKAPTDTEGRFRVDWEGPAVVRVAVEAKGFAERRQTVDLEERRDGLRIVLTPVAFAEQVTVTATGRDAPVGETPQSVALLTSEDLRVSAAPTLDDVLRQVAGFSLFRRTGSRHANPTTHGAQLRGIAGSGASRAVVLDDGVPLNDPFGGWIYWGRVPRPDVEQAEVVRGGGSALHGSGALAGVIQFRRRAERGRAADVEALLGTDRTVNGSLLAHANQENWGIRLAVEAYRTAGYIPLEPPARGAIDDELRSKFLNEEVTLDYAWSSGTRVFARGGIYTDKRRNGTRLQKNEAEIKSGVIGLDHPSSRGRFSLRFYGTDQYFEQTFTAPTADRRNEDLISEQQIPATSAGLGAQWARAIGSRNWLVLGAERLRVSGRSDEVPFQGQPRTSAGGRQVSLAGYGDLTLGLGQRGSLSLGARLDRWKNDEGERTVDRRTTSLASRDETALSPRAAILIGLGSRLSATASIYRAFRAPTLNELYRPFRVGDVLTQANEGLEAERLRGREAGLIFAAGSFSARATAFQMDVEDTIANLTLTTTPTLITRQRRNLGSVRSRGVEADAEVRSGRFAITVSMLRVNARVRDFPADVTLEGKRVPQVPREQEAVQVRYGAPRGFTIALQGRRTGGQYEDDRNQLRLGG